MLNSPMRKRAASGFDAELETPLPYLPWARLGVQHYRWDMTETDDIKGFKTALKMDLTRSLRAEAEYRHDNVETRVGLTLKLALGEPRGVEHTATDQLVATSAFQARDVSKHTLDRVERHHDIVVEKRNRRLVGLSGGVVIARGS